MAMGVCQSSDFAPEIMEGIFRNMQEFDCYLDESWYVFQ
jgi:hypothetical protein